MTDFNFTSISNMENNDAYKTSVRDKAKKLMGGKESITAEKAISIFKGYNKNLSHEMANKIQKIAAMDGDNNVSLSEMSAIYALFDMELGSDNKFHFDGNIGGDDAKFGIKEATDKELNSILKTFGAITSESSSSTELVAMAVVKPAPTNDKEPQKENKGKPNNAAAKKTENKSESKPQNNTAAKKTENKSESKPQNNTAAKKTENKSESKPQNNTAAKKTENKSESKPQNNTVAKKTENSSKNNTTVSSKKTESTNKTSAKSQTVNNTTQKPQKTVNPAKSATNRKS